MCGPKQNGLSAPRPDHSFSAPTAFKNTALDTEGLSPISDSLDTFDFGPDLSTQRAEKTTPIAPVPLKAKTKTYNAFSAQPLSKNNKTHVGGLKIPPSTRKDKPIDDVKDVKLKPIDHDARHLASNQAIKRFKSKLNEAQGGRDLALSPQKRRHAQRKQQIERATGADAQTPDGGPYTASEKRRIARHGFRDFDRRDVGTPASPDPIVNHGPGNPSLTEGQRRQKARRGRVTRPTVDIASPTQEEEKQPNRIQLIRREKREELRASRPERERQQLIQDRIDWDRKNSELIDDVATPYYGGSVQPASFDEWQQIKSNFKLVGVDILVGVYKLPEQTARQIMLTLEGAVNTAIKTKNLVMMRDTKSDELVILPKPNETNSVTGRLAANILGTLFQGGLAGKALIGMKSFQQYSKANRVKGDAFKSALGGFLFSQEKNSVLLDMFKDNTEVQDIIKMRINGEISSDNFTKSILILVEDAAAIGLFSPLVEAARLANKDKHKMDTSKLINEVYGGANGQGAKIRRKSRQLHN